MVLVILLTIGVGYLSLWNGDAMLGMHFNFGGVVLSNHLEFHVYTDPLKLKYFAVDKQIF